MTSLKAIPNIKAYAALLVVYIVWGTTFGAIHFGVETIPPALLVCARFLLAGLLLIVFCLLRGEALPPLAGLRREFIVGFLLFFGGNSIVSWAVQHVPTGLGGMLTATNPFWMIALAAVLPPREKIQPLAVVGLVIGFIGMVVLLLPKLTTPQTLSPLFWPSVASLLVMVFFWALGSVYVRKSASYSSILMGLGLQNLFAGLLLVPITWATVPTWEFTPSTSSMLALAYLVLMGTIVTAPCYFYVLRALPVAVSSTFAYVTPVITLLFGWLFLGEVVTPLMALGTGIILSGVIVVQYFGRKPAPFKIPAELSPKKLLF